MSFSTNSTTTSVAADRSGGDPITAIHPDIIQTHILNRLDGATLASTRFASSVVDIYCDDHLIYSKVLETETVSNWFLSFPLSLELLDAKEMVPTPLKFEGEDGACTSLASHKAVYSRLRWSNGDIQLRYATVAAVATGELVQCAVVVTCCGKEGGELHVKEVKERERVLW